MRAAPHNGEWRAARRHGRAQIGGRTRRGNAACEWTSEEQGAELNCQMEPSDLALICQSMFHSLLAGT